MMLYTFGEVCHAWAGALRVSRTTFPCRERRHRRRNWQRRGDEFYGTSKKTPGAPPPVPEAVTFVCDVHPADMTGTLTVKK
jgi:hypothetical protein